ncbi:hypothetical protein E4U46_005937 [Claviceps purpurea]|nr:hypothetical protein E4U46_005937 [Claviceps purpurea]
MSRNPLQSHFLAARAEPGEVWPTQWSTGAGGSSALQWLKVPSNREGAGERRHKQQQGWHWAEGPPGSSARQLATGESQSTNRARPERGCTSKAPSALLHSVAFRFALPTLAASLSAL